MTIPVPSRITRLAHGSISWLNECMKFTFIAHKEANGYNVDIKRDGKWIAQVWSAGTKSECLHQARIEAEVYGYLDE